LALRNISLAAVEGIAATLFTPNKDRGKSQNRGHTLVPVSVSNIRWQTFRPCLVPKNFQDSPSHRILRHIYKALNIDKKDN
jgi:hypothetical protein